MTWDITEEQRKVVEELKKRTINDVTPKMLEDQFLFYRFCKARDFNLSDAEDMLRKHIAWRKETQIETISQDYEPPEVLKKYLPSVFLCYDKEGFPVRYNDLGQLDMKGMWNSIKVVDLKKFLLIDMLQSDEERMHQQTKKLGKPVTKAVYIHNFDHFKFSNATHRKSLQFIMHLLKIYIDNFPERQKCAVVINASIYFTWLFNFVKPVLPQSIINSTKVYSSDGWKEELRDLIDPEDLPAFLGGNKRDPNGDPLCRSFVKHGQRIPEKYYICNIEKKLSSESDAEKLIVRPFSKEEISFQINQIGCLLEWEFEIKNRDIEFYLQFTDQDSATPVELIPKQRVDTCYEPEKGLFKCENEGLYTIVFDNSYSWLHPKEIYYRIKISEPNDTENE